MSNSINLINLPESSGCYLFKDSNGVIIYVGKANNIKKRVTSYFQKKDHDSKTLMLVDEIKNLDFFVTKNEVEALLLENKLIKKHYPKYNIDLKDSRRYAYLRIVPDEIPWVETVRQRVKGEKYYGPYVWGRNRKLILDILSRHFGILTYKPGPRKKKSINKEEYLGRLESAKNILKGKVNPLIKSLKKEMKKASSLTNYEYAMTLRNRLDALESLKEKQSVETKKLIDSHVINYLIGDGKVNLILFSVRQGVLEDKQEFEFEESEDFLNEFLMRYYTSNFVPDEVIVPKNIDPSIKDFLETVKSKKVDIIIPQKGDKKALLDLVRKNVEAQYFIDMKRLRDLKDIINLDKIPRVIECFDISHLGGKHTVASMVQFRDGISDKNNYRRFRIREDTGGDDFLAMQEVVRRRYSRLLVEDAFMPDLILIDGGLGQLGAATGILKKLGIKVPVISLAKKFEEIYVEGKRKPLKYKKNREGLKLLIQIRDEAHRFALNYNWFLRKKGFFE